MRALLIHDEIADSIVFNSISKFITCDACDSHVDLIDMAKHYDYDIIVFDWLSEHDGGCRTLHALRRASVTTPVLIVSGPRASAEKAEALDAGADDWLSLPFEQRELLARIQAIVRRSRRYAESTIRTGKLAIDLGTRVVTIDDQPLGVTPKEYRIIELFSLRRGRTLSKETILDHLYGGVDEPSAKIVDVLICKLRKKLEQATGGERYIETVWGDGYIMPAPSRAGLSPRRGKASFDEATSCRDAA